jgi:hypothetical protein
MGFVIRVLGEPFKACTFRSIRSLKATIAAETEDGELT